MDLIFSKVAATKSPGKKKHLIFSFSGIFPNISEQHWMFVSFGSIVKYRKENSFWRKKRGIQ